VSHPVAACDPATYLVAVDRVSGEYAGLAPATPEKSRNTCGLRAVFGGLAGFI
jgi:hypothetical protein